MEERFPQGGVAKTPLKYTVPFSKRLQEFT